VNRSRQLPAPSPLRYQAAPILLSQHAASRIESEFKPPGLPASARPYPLRSINYQDNRGRRNSLLSNQIYPPVTPSPEQDLPMAYASPVSYTSPFRNQSSYTPSPSAGSISCWLPALHARPLIQEAEVLMSLVQQIHQASELSTTHQRLSITQ
jgi:hypothetical protein